MALSDVDHAVRQLRNPTPFRGFAAARFSGAFSAATAFAASRWENNQLDIFREAAAAPKGSKDLRNNWLDKSQKPTVDVFPRALGVYIGDFGVSTERILTILTENSQLIIEQDNTPRLRQPLLTIPSGAAFARSVAATREIQATAADVPAAQHFAESFGPSHPVGLHSLADNLVFEKGKELKAYLEVDGAALTYLRAIATEIPSHGAVIGVIVHGIAEYPIDAAV